MQFILCQLLAALSVGNVSECFFFLREWRLPLLQAEPCVLPGSRLLAYKYGCVSGESIAKGLKATWLQLSKLQFICPSKSALWLTRMINICFKTVDSECQVEGGKRTKEEIKHLQFNYKVHICVNRHLGIRYWQKLLTRDSKQMLQSSAKHSHIYTAALKLGGALQGITRVGRTANLRCCRYHLSHPGRCQIIFNSREWNQPPTNTVSEKHLQSPSWCASIAWCMIAVRNMLHKLYPSLHIWIFEGCLLCCAAEMNWKSLMNNYTKNNCGHL